MTFAKVPQGVQKRKGTELAEGAFREHIKTTREKIIKKQGLKHHRPVRPNKQHRTLHPTTAEYTF